MNALREKIEQEIRQRGPIPFSRYMELCLYDPEFGYYSRGAAQFGKAGDFYTSSDVHAVFGRLMARRPTKVAAVALANKMARMAWAIIVHGERYREPAALRAA